MVRTRPQRPAWSRITDEQLLDLRLCDLGLSLERSPMQPRIDRLYSELDRAGLRFRPHVWIGTEWASPDGVPGFSVPFYLIHPRLLRIEHRMMGEVEGGTTEWSLRILRHETGHAFDSAYALRRRRDWRQMFGMSSKSYPPTTSRDPSAAARPPAPGCGACVQS